GAPERAPFLPVLLRRRGPARRGGDDDRGAARGPRRRVLDGDGVRGARGGHLLLLRALPHQSPDPRAGGSAGRRGGGRRGRRPECARPRGRDPRFRDRKSTRLNSSHVAISYAVFCLKKKKKIRNENEIIEKMQ